MLAVLHADLRLSGNVLVDSYLGIRYLLTADAAWLVAQLYRQPDIERVVLAVTCQKGLPATEARIAVHTLLGQLGTYGGVYMRWGQSYPLPMKIRIRSTWRSRYRGRRGFAAAMIRAYGWPAGLATMLFVLLRVSGAAFPWVWVMLPAAVFGTCVIHEAGHAYAAWRCKVRFVFLASIGYAAMMYARPVRRAERWIAFCGPLAAAVACLVGAVLVHQVLGYTLFAAVGLVHLCSLLPFFADGKTIWRLP